MMLLARLVYLLVALDHKSLNYLTSKVAREVLSRESSD